VAKVSAHDGELSLFRLNAPQGGNPSDGSCRTYLATQSINGIGRVNNDPSFANYLNGLSNFPAFWIIWMYFKDFSRHLVVRFF
jgi:hypothetical protein